MLLPRILLTTGEPAGIGPDLLIAAAERPFPCHLAVLGDPELLEARARRLGRAAELNLLGPGAPVAAHRVGILDVIPTTRRAQVGQRQPDPLSAAYVLEMIASGAERCMRGEFDALVTPPVHKGVINEAGFDFTGHTEFLAGITGGRPVMMLAVPGLRVALATTHLPLADISRTITTELLEDVLRVLHADLRFRFGIERPRILVCGLNPHAGEGGHLGREEIDVIAPAIARLQGEGLALTGPLPADTIFLPKYLAQADAVLAMYHDQGLPVLKYAGFGRAVNVTLGLPIIRTSVDHGTAVDLAGTGRADPGSLFAAIDLAIEMVQRSRVRVA